MTKASANSLNGIERWGRSLAAPVVVYGFFALWVYFGQRYGLLLGLGLGWLPAGILAYVAGRLVDFAWPAAIALAAFGALWGVMLLGSLLFGW